MVFLSKMNSRPLNGKFTSDIFEGLNGIYFRSKTKTFMTVQLINHQILLKESIWGFGKTRKMSFVNSLVTSGAGSFFVYNRSKIAAPKNKSEPDGEFDDSILGMITYGNNHYQMVYTYRV